MPAPSSDLKMASTWTKAVACFAELAPSHRLPACTGIAVSPACFCGQMHCASQTSSCSLSWMMSHITDLRSDRTWSTQGGKGRKEGGGAGGEGRSGGLGVWVVGERRVAE